MDDENCMVKSKSKNPIKMSRNILEYEMHSAQLYSSEEKISRTAMAEKLLDAKETVFTVRFNKKVDDKEVKKTIEGLTKADQ